ILASSSANSQPREFRELSIGIDIVELLRGADFDIIELDPRCSDRLDRVPGFFGDDIAWKALQDYVTQPSIKLIVQLAYQRRMNGAVSHCVLAPSSRDFRFDHEIFHFCLPQRWLGFFTLRSLPAPSLPTSSTESCSSATTQVIEPIHVSRDC